MLSDSMCEMRLSGFSAQMRSDRRMRDNETVINHVMFDGSDEIGDFCKSLLSDVKSIPQRVTMPGGAEEAVRVIASPQRGAKPGGVIGGPNDIDDPFLGVANRHERFIDDIIGQPLNPELCALSGIRSRTISIQRVFGACSLSRRRGRRWDAHPSMLDGWRSTSCEVLVLPRGRRARVFSDTRSASWSAPSTVTTPLSRGHAHLSIGSRSR